MGRRAGRDKYGGSGRLGKSRMDSKAPRLGRPPPAWDGKLRPNFWLYFSLPKCIGASTGIWGSRGGGVSRYLTTTADHRSFVVGGFRVASFATVLPPIDFE